MFGSNDQAVMTGTLKVPPPTSIAILGMTWSFDLPDRLIMPNLIERCPLLGPTQKTSSRSERFAF
jgi:hypothetical protein